MEKDIRNLLFGIKTEISNLCKSVDKKYTEIEMTRNQITVLEQIKDKMEDALNKTQEVKASE